jgi:DNA polymerase III epsilon subunit-like protein/DNA-binding XRE family transcriptional regulator
MDFVAIDFETANSSRTSACSVGIVEVSNGSILSEQSWLIDPREHFDSMNIHIHGIRPEMVKGHPTFQELWPTLQPYLNSRNIVAHNASFDMSVLRYCLDKCDLPYPTFDYFCTYLLSKRLLPDMPSYKLNVIAGHYGIKFNHHDALDDARAAASLLVKLMEQERHINLLQLSTDLGCKIGKMYKSGYSPFSAPSGKVHRLPNPIILETESNYLPKHDIIQHKGITLVHGQKTDLSKNLDSTKFLIEVDWDLINPDIEIDASAFLLYDNGKCQRDEDCIFYGNPDTRNGSISYSKIDSNKSHFKITYDKLPTQIQKIAFTLTIYEGEELEHYFNQVAEITIRVVDPLAGRELMRFNFGEHLTKETAIVIAEMYLYKGEWKFNPIGKGYYGGLRALCGDFGIEVKDETSEAAASNESILPKAVYDYDEAYYIGNNVEKLRRGLGYTQQTLAGLIGYKSTNLISKLERGEIERLTHDQLTSLAEALKVNIRQLLTK